jgi:hypothetical protein
VAELDAPIRPGKKGISRFASVNAARPRLRRSRRVLKAI